MSNPMLLLDRARSGDHIAEILYPRRRGPWPVRFADRDGRPVFGVFDPDTGTARTIEPTADPELKRLGRWLEKGELKSYRPTQRAVIDARVKGSRVFVKILPKKRAAAGRAAILSIDAEEPHRLHAFPRTPRLVLDDADRGVLVLGEVVGTPWHDRVMKGEGARDLERVAETLAAWHSRTRPSLGLRPETDLLTWIGYVRLEDRAFADRLIPVAARIEAADLAVDPGPLGRVHGDLHDKNIFIDDRQGIGFIDIDGVRDGAIATDIGNLAAHLYLRSLQRGEPSKVAVDHAEAFLQAHAKHRGDAAVAARVVVARTLLRIACLYRFRRRWRDLTPALADAAEGWRFSS